MVAEIALGPGSEPASGCGTGWCQVRERYVTAALRSGEFRKQHRRDGRVTAAVTPAYCW